jgi:hypothetical protein
VRTMIEMMSHVLVDRDALVGPTLFIESRVCCRVDLLPPRRTFLLKVLEQCHTKTSHCYNRQTQEQITRLYI